MTERRRKLSLSIHVGWTAEPFERVRRNFDGLWRWLELNGMADWHRVHAVAASFHPDYVFDQTTRAIRPNPPIGSRVYLQMERGQYKREWVALCMPVLDAAIPHPRRGAGLPHGYFKSMLVVSALLAAHEFERLRSAIAAQSRDPEAITRHLYWFERFYAMWQRTSIDKPPAYENNEAKAKTAQERTARLLALHAKRLRSIPGGKATARQTAIEFAGSESAPEFWQDYRALLTALKVQRLKAKRKPHE